MGGNRTHHVGLGKSHWTRQVHELRSLPTVRGTLPLANNASMEMVSASECCTKLGCTNL